MKNMAKNVYILRNGKLRTLLITNDGIGCGCETSFLPINSRRGLKVFNYRDNAQKSFIRQKKAYSKGIGPRVLSEKIFKVIIPLGFERMIPEEDVVRRRICNLFEQQECWGYITQRAEMVKDSDDYTDQELSYLEYVLERTFPNECHDDTHDGNLGRIKGKLVMVDFGNESVF